MPGSPVAAPPRRPAALVALAVVVAVEAVEALAVAVVIVLAALGARAPVDGVAAGATVLLVAVLLAVLAAGTLRARPWTRAATFVWQFVQLLIGVYAFQGTGAAVDFGLAAVVPAVIALVLLLTPAVRLATARPPR